MALGVNDWPLVACQRNPDHGFHPIVECCPVCGSRKWTDGREITFKLKGKVVTGSVWAIYSTPEAELEVELSNEDAYRTGSRFVSIKNPKDIISLKKRKP